MMTGEGTPFLSQVVTSLVSASRAETQDQVSQKDLQFLGMKA